MIDSNRPTPLRPPSKLKHVVNVLELGKALAAVLSGIMTASGVIWASYSWFTTDQELMEHDLSPTAHRALRDEITSLKKEMAEQSARVQDSRDGTYISLKYAIRLRASDREPSHLLKKAAADFYEEEFESLVRKGEGLEQAFTESLRTPWHDRPRVR